MDIPHEDVTEAVEAEIANKANADGTLNFDNPPTGPGPEDKAPKNTNAKKPGF